MSEPRWVRAALVFLRVGNTTFGGGIPTIAVLQRELDRRKWLSAEQFAVAFGLARVTPGTNVLAFCAATGWFIAGLAGAIAAVFTVSIPSSVLVVWLTHVCELGVRSPRAQSVIAASVAAAVGTMLAAAVILVKSQCSKSDWVRPVLIAAAAFTLARWVGLSPLQIIALAALGGFVWVKQ
jgi:chromate transporter